MIKSKIIKVYGFEEAIKAMRNPMNSWDKSDSFNVETVCLTSEGIKNYNLNNVIVGNNDLDLMKKLNKAGVEHRTWARMISVYMDIEAPLYW